MKIKILTIDDSNVIRKILKNAFSEYNCTVFEGINGEDGLQKAAEINPDLIILDIDMPVMNGWDTLASIRFNKDLEKTPVIMLTASTDEENVHRAEALGVAGFVKKPFTLKEIVKHVGKYIKLPSK
jgi:DNA-binding response OmpR family regulator